MDDVVVVGNSNTVRGNWTIATVIMMHSPVDGKVRNVRLKIGTGKYERLVSRIVVFTLEEDVAKTIETFSSGGGKECIGI